jgi:hypothetical protein
MGLQKTEAQTRNLWGQLVQTADEKSEARSGKEAA